MKNLIHIVKSLLVSSVLFLNLSKLSNVSKLYKNSDEFLKFQHILEAINYIRVAGISGAAISQVYYEFGCHSGRTFSSAINSARFLKMNNMKFYAFDSFEGLPAVENSEGGYFKAGEYSTSVENFLGIVKGKTGVALNKDNIVKGFYCDSLTPELQESLPKVGVVHIDVDLYSSTVSVLNFIKPLLTVGSVLLFDDWYCYPPNGESGECRAVKEFIIKNSNITLKEWKSYSTFGQSFFVTSLTSP